MRLLAAFALLIPLSLSADVIDDLLRLPAPPPGELARPRATPEKAPPDDAPLAELVAWWAKAWMSDSNKPPSPAVRERLIEAIPQNVESIYRWLPPRADVCERVKRMRASDNVSNWVLHNTGAGRLRRSQRK